jgi:hypothetical protein
MKRHHRACSGAANLPADPPFGRTAGLLCWAVLLTLGPVAARAGPPFVTDDPEPVPYRHWEFYAASQTAQTADDWSGTAPHIELNYGAIPNVQLHLIAPMAYDAPSEGERHYGYGDTELGVKYRFLEETGWFPQAGVFPLLELPTGDSDEGLGGGHVQAFLPLWLQKDVGSWTFYGGGGYGLNPGAGNRNWTFVGAVAQVQARENILVGAELYHRTPTEVGAQAETAFDVGTVIDFTPHHHLLFSAGRSLDGPTQFQAYLAYQLTFGPHSLSANQGLSRMAVP